MRVCLSPWGWERMTCIHPIPATELLSLVKRTSWRRNGNCILMLRSIRKEWLRWSLCESRWRGLTLEHPFPNRAPHHVFISSNVLVFFSEQCCHSSSLQKLLTELGSCRQLWTQHVACIWKEKSSSREACEEFIIYLFIATTHSRKGRARRRAAGRTWKRLGRAEIEEKQDLLKVRPVTEEELRVKVYQRCVWVHQSMMMPWPVYSNHIDTIQVGIH